MSKRSVTWIVGAALLAVTGLLLWYLNPGPSVEAPKLYRAASILMLEGPYKSYGENVRVGIQVAVSDIEQETGKHLTVDFISFDGDPAKALEKTQTAVEADGHRFVIEVFGTSAALAVANYVNQKQVLVVSAVNTGDPLSTQMGHFMFRVIPSDSEAVKAQLKWAAELGVTQATVVAVSTDWGRGVADILASNAAASGIMLTREEVDKAHTLFEPIVDAAKSRGDNGVFLALNPDQAGNFVRALKTQNFAPVVMGTDNLTGGEFTTTAGAAAVGVRYVLPPNPPENEVRKSAVEALRAKLGLGADEQPHPFALYGYDATWVAFRAMEASEGRTPDAVTFLERYSGVGATGPIAFTENHDVVLASPYQRFVLEASGEAGTVQARSVER